MKESEIRLIVGELIGAMENNRIDAFSAWEPTVSAALSRHKEFKAIHRFLNSNYLYQTRQFAQQHPDASLQIHASFVRSLHWMNASNFKRDGFLGRSFEFLKNQGNIPAETSWEKIRVALDNKMVKAVLADTAKYRLDNFYPELDE